MTRSRKPHSDSASATGTVLARIGLPDLQADSLKEGGNPALVTFLLTRLTRIDTRADGVVVAELLNGDAKKFVFDENADAPELDMAIAAVVTTAGDRVVNIGPAKLRLRFIATNGTEAEGRALAGAKERESETVLPDTKRFRQAIRRELEAVPSEFGACRDAMRALHGTTREEMARAFSSIFNRELQSKPRGNYAEKKVLANWANEELRQLALTVRCPRSSRPGLLRANPTAPNGRFMIETADEQGRLRYTWTSVELPELELVPADLGRAPRGSTRHR